MIINGITSVNAPPERRVKIVIRCTKCGNIVRNDDCGTSHRPGSAQQQLQLVRA